MSLIAFYCTISTITFLSSRDAAAFTTDRATVLELHVAQADMGKVIGKQGRIAKAIRSVVKAAASREDKKVIVEIVQ